MRISGDIFIILPFYKLKEHPRVLVISEMRLKEEQYKVWEILPYGMYSSFLPAMG